MNKDIENLFELVEEGLRENLSYNPSKINELYKHFPTPLDSYFSNLHNIIISSIKSMNSRLPKKEEEAHFQAYHSRRLFYSIDYAFQLFEGLKNTELEIVIDEKYYKFFRLCLTFLKTSGGSTIPKGMEKMEPYIKKEIFIKSNQTIIKNTSHAYNRKPIGEGSYAKVYKYKDEFYNKWIAVKKAKESLTAEELNDFKLEYKIAKELNSINIIEVYGFKQNDNEYEYYMEYLDSTLEDYINKNNNKLEWKDRKNIVYQLFNVFKYIHSRGIYHRDISTKNVLIKKYDNKPEVIIKLSDFGLVKIKGYDKTKTNTNIKGIMNDHANLEKAGFKNYSMEHEIFAITKLIYFVCTGKSQLSDSWKNSEYKNFIQKGTNSKIEQRPKNIDELQKLFIEIDEYKRKS
ncbi:protein kinase family protein [Mycoplasma yeatsii]|uniref:tRNA A-37 threonylcarbamoyl transferase component Bud32 n=1 Tax=Mycoplasma yeatsii TaxID=51365 RepID=A0ABU0NDI0_9MOLU|nr:protein kinase family protein [Mycoplasma yeatsii]MDQ0567506.1 tRNA A-37 threonylcarbamoyl transferase component Bud32 [Mycoplasma yeatsii]